MNFHYSPLRRFHAVPMSRFLRINLLMGITRRIQIGNQLDSDEMLRNGVELFWIKKSLDHHTKSGISHPKKGVNHLLPSSLFLGIADIYLPYLIFWKMISSDSVLILGLLLKILNSFTDHLRLDFLSVTIV